MTTNDTADTACSKDSPNKYHVTEFGADLLCMFGTLFLFHAGYVGFGGQLPHPLGVIVAVIFPWAAGLTLLAIAVSPIDPRPHGRVLAFVVVASVLIGNIVVTFSQPPGFFEFGTDVLFFTRQAVDALAAGVNPYSVEMTADAYGDTAPTITPTIDGGNVSSFSYPAGAFLAFMPQRVTGIGKIPLHLTPLVVTVAAVTYQIAVSPREIAVVPAVIAVGLGFFTDATNGLIESLWLFPLLVAMHALASDDWTTTGIFFGLAASIKQQPWLIAPFLLIWAATDTSAKNRAQNVFELVATSTTVFLTVNLPFIIWQPTKWLEGVFTPVYNSGGAPLIPRGVGLVALRTGGVAAIPKPIFTILVAATAVICLVLYARVDGRWRWVAFLMPPVILFVHWRSLPSYFAWYVPVAYMAYLGATDVLPERDRRSLPVIFRRVTHED